MNTDKFCVGYPKLCFNSALKKSADEQDLIVYGRAFQNEDTECLKLSYFSSVYHFILFFFASTNSGMCTS